MSNITSIKTDNGKRRLTSGDDYKPVEIKNPGQAMQACLHLFMSHSVDFFELMLEVVSDKYEIPKEEMVAAVMADPRIKNMSVNPIIHSLGYFDDTDLQKSFAKLKVSKGEGAATAAATVTATVAAKKSRVRVRVPRKNLRGSRRLLMSTCYSARSRN